MRLFDRSQFRRPPRVLGSRSSAVSARAQSSLDAQRRAVADSQTALGGARESRGPDPTDEHLLALAHRRALGVEAMLYARLAPLVGRLVWHLLGPDSESEDTIHEVFIRIFRGVARLRDAGRLEEWTTRVTINAVKNEFRRRRLRRLISWGAADDSEVLRYFPDFEHRELLARTYRVLERLPADERIVLAFDLFETRTIGQIAADVGVSVRTVKRRLKKARERFERIAGQDAVLAPWLGDRMAKGGRS